MENNKKVKNARKRHYDGIDFESGLEVDTYKALKDAGFEFEYNAHTYHVWHGKKFQVPCYDLYKSRKLKKKVWGLNEYKPIDIKYTPDYTFVVTDKEGVQREIFLEAKGNPNERYIYVKKLFRQYLEDNYPNSMFFEVHNKKQIYSAIEIIKNLSA